MLQAQLMLAIDSHLQRLPLCSLTRGAYAFWSILESPCVSIYVGVFLSQLRADISLCLSAQSLRRTIVARD